MLATDLVVNVVVGYDNDVVGKISRQDKWCPDPSHGERNKPSLAQVEITGQCLLTT